jgi:hypothetical protein
MNKSKINNKINTTNDYIKYNYYNDIDFQNINFSKLSSDNYNLYDKKASRKIQNTKKYNTKLFKKEFYSKINY